MTKMNNKMVLFVLALGLFFGAPASAMANESTTESVFFDLKINNPKGDKLTLVVVNDEGDVVFLKNYDGKTGTEKITLSNNQELTRYQFAIWSAGETGEIKPVVIKQSS